MVEQAINLNVGLGTNLVDIVTKAFMVLNFTSVLSIIGIAGVTFGILDVFMGTKMTMKYKELTDEERTKFTNSIWLLICILIPIVVCTLSIVQGRYDFVNMLVFIAIGIIGSWIFSYRLKKILGKPTKKQFMTSEAVGIALDTISSQMATWLQRAVIGFINLLIETIHGPFIMYYILMATVLNLVLSFVLTGFMGVSQAAGTVNVIGSLIGGIAHGLIRRKKIEQLKLKYSRGEATI